MTDAGSGFHSDAFSLLLPASAWLHDCHPRYRRPYIIAHWILFLFLRWLKWDRGIPGLGICHTRCEAENDQILLKTCSSRLAHVFGLRSFISQVKNADNCSSTKSKSFNSSGSRSSPQQSIMTKCVPSQHLGKVGKTRFLHLSFLDAHGAGPSVIRFSCTFLLDLVCSI